MGAHDDTESGRVPGVEFGQVQDQVTAAGVDRRVQGRTGVRRAADVEAAPDDQLGVVAPDVHSHSPGSAGGAPVPDGRDGADPYVFTQLTVRRKEKLPSVSEPIPNSLL